MLYLTSLKSQISSNPSLGGSNGMDLTIYLCLYSLRAFNRSSYLAMAGVIIILNMLIGSPQPPTFRSIASIGE